MSRLNALDQPYLIEAEPPDVPRQLWPANFEEMTPEELAGWPARATRRWALQWLPGLPVVVLIAGVVWFWTGSMSVGLGALGLLCDVVGVWMLAQGLLLTEEEAYFRHTYGWNEYGYLLAVRDRRQTRVALIIATLGFALQLVGLVISSWPMR